MSTIPPEQSIRYIIGAVGSQESLLTDEEIADALVMYPADWRLAAAYIAESLASRAINSPESFGLTGVLNVSWGDRAAAWTRLAKTLKEGVAADAAISDLGTIQVTQLRREFLAADPTEYSTARRDRGRFNNGHE